MKSAGNLLILSVIIICASCTTGGTPAPDIHTYDNNDFTTPIVEIYTPSDNQVFASGDTIKVDGKVTDNSLYRGSVRITDDATGSVIKEQLYEIHGFTSYNFHIEYKTAVSAISNYTVSVQFEDHGANNGFKSAKIKVNP